MKRILLALIISAGTALVAQAQPTSSAPDDKNGPVIKFDVESYSFDTITQGEVVVREFKFTNTGRAPLILTDVIVGCGCTVPSYSKEPISPGKTGIIKVEFRSTGKMGPQDKTATVKSNSNGGDVVLHLKGTIVAPAPALAPKDASQTGTPVNK